MSLPVLKKEQAGTSKVSKQSCKPAASQAAIAFLSAFRPVGADAGNKRYPPDFNIPDAALIQPFLNECITAHFSPVACSQFLNALRSASALECILVTEKVLPDFAAAKDAKLSGFFIIFWEGGGYTVLHLAVDMKNIPPLLNELNFR